ncbi:MAG: Cof-type HAD-IIB family hydrolase [Bacilli bacterium]|nr:Cof-type HAD-IIB family hydrolase [Bacilli bacterium]
MRKSDIKIVFVDIDLTVYDSGKFDIASLKALRKAQEKYGVKVFFATARPYESAMQTRLFDFINPDGVVSCNGTTAMVGNETIYSDPFPKEVVKNVIDTCNKYGIVVEVATAKDRFFSLPSNDYVEGYIKEYYETVPEVKSDFSNDEVNALLVFAPKEFDERFSLKFDKSISMIRFTTFGMDLRTHPISKADGLRAVMDYYGFKKDEAMAVGDSDIGDSPMYEVCKYSVAMGNSKGSLKEKAYFVTKSVKEHGVKYALEMLNII